MDLPSILCRVPEYRDFPTPEELHEWAGRVAGDQRGLVRCHAVGESAEGRPIDLLSIGGYRDRALLIGVPHPNEPVGALTIQFLVRLLCEDEGLREELGYTVLIVPCADPDGLALNGGWLKGEFSLLRYALNYYRPPHHEQAEWSFPVHYRTLHFDTPSPETRAIMAVMNEHHPSFLYSLHNAGFCGVYYYLSDAIDGLLERLPALVADAGLPLHRGEAEVPYASALAPGIFQLFGIREIYDYLARHTGGDPAKVIAAGTSSDDYLRRLGPCFSLVSEVPYYTSPALARTEPGGMSRREAIQAGLASVEALHGEVAEHLSALPQPEKPHRLHRSVADYVKKTPTRIAALRAEVEGPAYAREALEAEVFDATVCRAFYHYLYLGEVYRLAVAAEQPERAERIRRRLEALFSGLEAAGPVEVLPLRPLVTVQAGSALLALEAWKRQRGR